MTLPRTAERAVPRRVAQMITYALSPIILAAVELFIVPIHAAGVLPGLGWGLLAVVFICVVPVIYVLVRVRRQTLTDIHIGVREHRNIPFAVGLGMVVVALGLLAATGAPRDLLVLVSAFVVLVAATIVITHWWKISVHAMVAMMTAGVLTIVYGPAAVATLLLVAAIGWARVELRDHTVEQVVAGNALGLVITVIIALAR
jgi:hypothetical protein